MNEIISKLYNSSLNEILHYAKAKIWFTKPYTADENKTKRIFEDLKKRFAVYQAPNLQSISAKKLKEFIYSRIGVVDAAFEGYSENELDRQRDLSVKFHWGHNHDFGDFKIKGAMGDRHIYLLANFLALFPICLEDFKNKMIFDIGCWTGGTTLLLASLGGSILAIEEVKKYAETASFLTKSFGLDQRVSVKPVSIYDCNCEDFYDRFDIVYFPGVIYHLSDPLLALRILFNSLKVGGVILVESAGINRQEAFCRFDGSQNYCYGVKKKLNRVGWNWFLPSPLALYRMMREAGFDEVKTQWHDATHRLYGYGRKTSQVGICKAGLSIPNIK